MTADKEGNERGDVRYFIVSHSMNGQRFAQSVRWPCSLLRATINGHQSYIDCSRLAITEHIKVDDRPWSRHSNGIAELVPASDGITV